MSFLNYIRSLDPIISSSKEITLFLTMRGDSEGISINVKLNDLEAFLSGFTISNCLVDGTYDRCRIKIMTTTGFKLVELQKWIDPCFSPYGVGIHTPFVLLTDDGAYDDPELSRLQDLIADNPTKVADAPRGSRMAINIDDLMTTLLAEDAPPIFYKGLEIFQTLSNTCETHIINH